MSELISKEAFKVIEGRPVTSSRIVAEYFGKQHHHVVRDIRSLVAQKPELEASRNFAQWSEQVEIGSGAKRSVTCYWMDRKGFAILAMGFTGAKALDFKCAFYDEFERMEKALHPTIDSFDDHTTINEAQQREIQRAVGKRAAKTKCFAAVYRALKNHFNIPRYTCLLAKDFEEAIAFIETCELQTPVAPEPEPEQPMDGRCPCCGLTPLPKECAVLTASEAKAMLTFIYYVRFAFSDAFERFYDMLRASESPFAGKIWDAFHEVPWTRILAILANSGYDIRDMDCYKHWLARKAA